MGNFTTNESSVRVDIFKSSGKWYSTIVIDMEPFYNEPIVSDAVAKALVSQTNYKRSVKSNGWFAICLDPYHRDSSPVMINIE